MRDNHFVVLIFFSILSIIVTTVYSSILISKVTNVKSSLDNN
ncbi:hypothetical protein ACLM5H_22610 [Fredinandcohnia humi]